MSDVAMMHNNPKIVQKYMILLKNQTIFPKRIMILLKKARFINGL